MTDSPDSTERTDAERAGTDGAGAEPAGSQGAQDLTGRLHGSGKRLTPQRELILRAVDALGHATPDAILTEVRKHASSVNVSTVYRNLEVLEELGLIRHAHLSDRAPTYHSVRGHEHFHIVCRNCGKVTSIGPWVMAPVTERLAEEQGFVTDIGHLTIFGTCVDCDSTP